MNYPLMLLGAVVLGAIGGAASNAIQEHDIVQSIKAGIAQGIAIATTVFLVHFIFGLTLTS